MSDDIKKGLLGIVVDETEISKVMPEINSLTYRGYAAQDLWSGRGRTDRHVRFNDQ